MDFPRSDNITVDYTNPLEFQIIDIYIPENDKFSDKPEEPELYSMLFYGVMSNGNTISVNITGYEPYFYIEPPTSWNTFSDSQFIQKIDELTYSLLNNKYECEYLGNKYEKKIINKNLKDHLKSLKLVKKKKFWGFTNNADFRFIKVVVKSLKLFNNLKYYFTSLKKSGFKLYESNIDPYIRYMHQFNIKPCSWVKIEKYVECNNDTRTDYNIETNYKNLIPIDITNIAPLLIASFDIECSSSHGDFPVAKKDYKKVAQDLAIVAKSDYLCDKNTILNWMQNMYFTDISYENDIIINRVYAKHIINPDIISNKLNTIIDDIIIILNKISDLQDSDDEEEDKEDIENENVEKKINNKVVKEQSILENSLNNILTSSLPPLKGDLIIQIGTTVHKYGSDKIIYKNIISLGSCDNIEDCEVISCKNEKQVLIEWRNLISRLNPDILIGYNIFGFDMEYMWIRANECGILDEFSIQLGKKMNRKTSIITQKLASSALGENILKYIDFDGIVLIDLYKVIQRDHKLDSYKLDNVASFFIGDKKDDLKPHEIFEKFKGSSTDRAIIAKYCIQDCALVNKLLHKLKILENNIGMGNVCLIPLNFLFRRGQGIKIFSLISKQCMDKNQLIPVINYNEYDIQEDGYEGAVVLEPKEGIYLNDPIVVFDYGSLYPSSMIARNLSHDCYIMDKKYMINDPNIDYITVSYDIYEGIGDKKKKCGVKDCIFVQYKNGKKRNYC